MTAPAMSFSSDTINYLARLRANNNRQWFLENKGDLEKFVLNPARQLVTDIGCLLSQKVPGLIADPRTNQSIYRFNRDMRFSRDKTPYKSHLALWWWQPLGHRVESPGFYFHLTPDGWLWSVGLYRFPENVLQKFREVILDDKKGMAFEKIVSAMETKGMVMKGPDLKRVPHTFDAAHPRSKWLRYTGLYTWAGEEEGGHPLKLFSPDWAEELAAHFLSGLKFHQFLCGLY